MVKRVLMVAYHFPPIVGSSGIQRTLRFSQYLPEAGWEPTILTAHPRAYPNVAPSGAAELDSALHVRRAFALDTAKHLAIGGWYSRFLSVPDRWWSWWLGAVPAGLALVRKQRPDVLWSTYPIATAHMIGYTLHRLTGVPWVADFRDPMAQPGYPPDPLAYRAYEWIESRVIRHCQRAVFTAPGAVRLYAERYPDVPSTRLALVENGYDESSFAQAGQAAARQPDQGPLLLLHSGTIYRSERDPRPFFAALARLRKRGRLAPGTIKVVLRATGCDEYLAGLIGKLDLGDIVTLAPPIDYRGALAEMLTADGLIVLQAENCNYQVPAKVYEYLRAQRPVLALTDPHGDTAGVLRAAGIETIAPLDDETAIERLIERFVDALREGSAPVADAQQVAAASRRARTGELAAILNAVASEVRGHDR